MFSEALKEYRNGTLVLQGLKTLNLWSRIKVIAKQAATRSVL